jgi:hypothetical protein
MNGLPNFTLSNLLVSILSSFVVVQLITAFYMNKKMRSILRLGLPELEDSKSRSKECKLEAVIVVDHVKKIQIAYVLDDDLRSVLKGQGYKCYSIFDLKLALWIFLRKAFAKNQKLTNGRYKSKGISVNPRLLVEHGINCILVTVESEPLGLGLQKYIHI